MAAVALLLFYMFIRLCNLQEVLENTASVASQWLELLHQDTKGRLAAFRRSKKRDQYVIHTELPLLMSQEFSCNQKNDPYVMKNFAAGCSNNASVHVDVHQARWSALFEQMDKGLSEQEKQLFLSEQRAEYTATLVRMWVLPLYTISTCLPYLIASANWVLGELASCLPENDYLPPEWLPLLQIVVSRIADEGEETSILFQLLGTLVEAGNEPVSLHIPYIISSLVGTISKCIPLNPEPWPQMVEQGFAALAVMAQCWEDSMPEEDDHNESSEVWVSGRATIARALSNLLQQGWLRPAQQMIGNGGK